FERRLAGRVLPVAGLNHVAHDALVDARGIDLRACDGFPYDHRAELRGGEVLQGAEKLSSGQTNGGNDNGIAKCHTESISMRVTASGPSSCCNRARTRGRALRTSTVQRGSDTRTRMMSCSSSTVVTRASADPTASCHANAVFSCDAGCRRMSSERTR